MKCYHLVWSSSYANERKYLHISIHLGQKFAQSLLFMDLPTLFYDARHMKTVTKPLKIYVYYLMAWLDHKLYAYFIFIAVCRTVPPTILIASTATIPLVPPTANVHNLFPFRYTFYVMNVILPSLMTSVLLLSIFFCTPAQKVCIHNLSIAFKSVNDPFRWDISNFRCLYIMYMVSILYNFHPMLGHSESH